MGLVDGVLARLQKVVPAHGPVPQRRRPARVVSAMSRLVRGGVTRTRMHIADVAMDLRLGVRTGGFVDNEGFLTPLSAAGDPHAYEPIRGDWWRRTMSALPPVPAESTFVDLGAGRGRPMILAARMGFRHVVGVELDPELAAAAARNVQRWRKHRGPAYHPGPTMTVVRADAATFPLPGGPLVIFMANPFGPETLRRVLQNAVARDTEGRRDLVILYFNPVHADVFEDFPSLSLHDRGRDWVVYRLASATATP